MEIKVLGSAAGGGFPQWNCACRNCTGVRTGIIRAKPRTQTQLAVSLSPLQWLLVGASPDLRSQILSAPVLTPVRPPRHSPIGGVLLTSADIDSVAGLLHLREFQPLHIFATPSVRRVLTEDNRIFRVLDRADPRAVWHDISLNHWFPLPGLNSVGNDETADPLPPSPTKPARAGFGVTTAERYLPSSHNNGLCCRAVSLGDSFPDYVSEALLPSLNPEEAVIGMTFEQAGKKLFFAPSISGRSDEWKQEARSSDLCLIDGTFWRDDELIAVGASSKTARQIGHVPLCGPQGLLAEFGSEDAGQRILIHINNTNPILNEESPEHEEVLRRGWQIAYDGMEIRL